MASTAQRKAPSTRETPTDYLARMNSVSMNSRSESETLLKSIYQANPLAYVDQVLGAKLWYKQAEIAVALTKHQRVFVKASHAVGKSFVAAALVNWHFDCFNPGVTITTAPTAKQVTDILWKEVRVQRRGRPGLLPVEPRMFTAANHYAEGYTSVKGDAFQGRHQGNIMLVFDEATGVDGPFWDASEGMMTSPHPLWLTIMNPTDTASKAYEEEASGRWHTITISALDHPNIAAELDGLPAPFPDAVRLAWVNDKVHDWCDPIHKTDRTVNDIEWPPQSGTWWRPGPLFEGRVLGRWPTQGSRSVWNEAMWEASVTEKPIDERAPTVIGCDVARHGDDYTSIVVRRGPTVIHHETHNGWDTSQIAGRMKELARAMKAPGQDPTDVACNVDDVGVGGGVVDQSGDYKFVPINGNSRPMDKTGYPNKRSELWFTVAELAKTGDLDISRLSPTSLMLLRRQAMAPSWQVDNQGRREVEGKANTKKRINRSPDDMDALNLAFALGKRTLEWS